MYASSGLTSSTALPGEEMISNQTSCFGNALSGCSIITINILMEILSKIIGVKIPEFHRLNEDFIPSLVTTYRFGQDGATICEEVTSNLRCHTVYPLEIGEFCTPAVFDSWIHRIEECTKLNLRAHGCIIEKPSDVTRCEGLKETVTQCVKDVGDTPCHYMKVRIFNVGIPLVISVPQDYLPLVKGNKEHIRKAVEKCLNTMDEDAVNMCVPGLFDALLSIGMENQAYRPTSLRSEKNSNCLKPLFANCSLLSRESLQAQIQKEYGVFVNLTFGEVNVKWFSEISGGSGKVTVFGVQESSVKESQYLSKKPCSSMMLLKWEDSLTKCLATVVVDTSLRNPGAVTLKRIIDETNKCMDKEGPLPCHLETRSDYEQLLTYLLDLIRRHTIVQNDQKCLNSLKYENIRHCAHNMYLYLTHLETSPNSAAAMARENEKNQECLSRSLSDCSESVVPADIMSIFMRAVDHQASETKDVLGGAPYRYNKVVGIHPMYGGVVTVCEEEPRVVLPETTPIQVPLYSSETKMTRIPYHTRHFHTKPSPSISTPEHTRRYRTRVHIPEIEVSRMPFPETTIESFLRTFYKPSVVPPTEVVKQFQTETTEEELTETMTEPTSSPQCSEEEVEAWMQKTQDCSGARIFQLYKAKAEKCLEIDSSSVFGNVSLCVSEMEPLMSQCGHERIYVFESIMEHFQKMIQQLKAEATQKCQNTKFCFPEKPQLVKCAGPFYDHMREMRDTGKNYESSLSLRSMRDIDQCLTGEMQKCAKTERRMFKEMVFITYGVEIVESSRMVQGSREYCYMYKPQQVSGTKTIDFRTKAECGPDDTNRWLKTIRKCLNQRTDDLAKQTFNLQELSSKKAFRYIEMCIHVHRVLSCKPSKKEVFESLFKQLLSNSKEDLMKLVETLKPQIPNVQDAVECIQELDNENMQKCIPVLYKDMNNIYADVSAKMDGSESQRCVANALTKCRDKTLKEIDYILKSGMGILDESEKPRKEKNESVNICRPTKAIDIGYRECTSSDMHSELQYIGSCLEKFVSNRPPNSITLESGVLGAKKCVEKYMLGVCYLADVKLMSNMVRYTFQLIFDNLKKYLTEKDLQCIKGITKSHILKCVPLSYSYTNSLRKGEVVGAMSGVPGIFECMGKALKQCSQTIRKKFTDILGTLSRVRYVPITNPIAPVISKKGVQEIRNVRDLSNGLEQYDSDVVIFNNPTEESSETTTLIETSETEVDEEMENLKVIRWVREVVDDTDTTLETSRDDIPTDEMTKEDQDPEEYMIIQGKDEINNVTKTDLLALRGCNESTFSGWINNYRECFISSKYKDDGRDLNNINKRILVRVQECMKYSTEKRCFPSWIQVEEYLGEVVFQAKDYAEMYLSEIRQGREDITDLRCIENLSLDWYRNCTTNIFKYLDYLRNHLVSSNGFEEHVKKTALCMKRNYDDCSIMAITAFTEVVELLLDLRNGTIGNQTILLIEEKSVPHEEKSIGAKIVDFLKSVGETIAKPFVWLYNAIKNFFHW